MPINFNLDAANVGLEVSETINTDRGDIVRMVRLSKTRTMLVGPSLPEGTTVIWENPPDDVSEITVGEAWAKAKKIAKKVIDIVLDDDNGSGGSGSGGSNGGGGNSECTQTNTTVIIQGNNVGGVTINCSPQ